MPLKKLTRHKDFKALLENFVSLTVLNGINFFFPLVLIPYLTRVLGVEGYGVYAFTFAVLNYLLLLSKYGFDLSATKQVAIIRDDKNKLEQLFSAVLGARLFLVVIALVIIVVLTLFIPKFQKIDTVLYSGMGVFIGNALIPIWFFQGMEKMKFMTIINFVVRAVSTGLIFVFVKSPTDLALAFQFHSIGFILGGVLSLFLAYRYFKMRFVFPGLKSVKHQLQDGWQLFVSIIGINFYRESNVIILGFLTSNTFVGYYAASEKVIKAIQSLLSPFVNTIFPYFSRRLNDAEEGGKSFSLYQKTGLIYSLVLLVFSIVAFIAAPFIIKFYLGIDYQPALNTIRILSVIILVGGLNYYYGIIGLVNMSKEKYFTRSVWTAGLVSLMLCAVLAPGLKANGAGIAMVIAESLLFVQIFMHRKKIQT